MSFSAQYWHDFLTVAVGTCLVASAQQWQMSGGHHIGQHSPIWDGFVVATVLDSSTISRMTVALSSCGITPREQVFFSSFLKKKKRKKKRKKKGLCVYSLQTGALAAQMQLCGAGAQGAEPLISREAPPASVGEHPGPAWEEGK